MKRPPQNYSLPFMPDGKIAICDMIEKVLCAGSEMYFVIHPASPGIIRVQSVGKPLIAAMVFGQHWTDYKFGRAQFFVQAPTADDLVLLKLSYDASMFGDITTVK